MMKSLRPVLFAAALLALPAAVARGQEPAAKPEVKPVVQTGHSGQVEAACFSPDGKYLLSGSADQMAILWHAETGQELRVLMGHTRPVTGVAFFPGGKRVLTVSRDATARVWDAETGQALHVIGCGHFLLAAAVSPDGKHFAVGCPDKAARLFDAQTGQKERDLKGHGGQVHAVAFSPDGKRLLTGSTDGARLWVADGKKDREFKGHGGAVRAVAFSPDGKLVLTGGADKTARLWDAESGEERLVLKGHTDAVLTVAFSPDGKRLITGGEDRSARVWDATTGKEMFAVRGGHRMTAVAFAPDGKRLLAGGGSRSSQVCDAATGKQLFDLEGDSKPVHTVTFSPDGKRLATAAGAVTTLVWDAEDGGQPVRLRGHTNSVNGVAFAPDGKSVLTGSVDRTARLWDVRGGRALAVLRGHTGVVRPVAISPDGRRALTGSDDTTARLWELPAGKELFVLKGHAGGVIGVSFSPDGKRLLTGSEDKGVRLWDADTGKELASVTASGKGVMAVAFSPDGRRLLSGTRDGVARLWDADGGKELRAFNGHQRDVTSVAFSADGKLVLTASIDHTARLWDAATGKELRKFEGHTSAIRSAVFSPDGKHVLTGSDDQTAALWDAATGKERCRLTAFHNGWAVTDPAGRYDASGGGDVVGLHFVVGTELISLSQLKERYYEPALLAKHLGLSREPLRDVSAFQEVKLFPEVAVEQADPKAPEKLGVTLTNRGGGIGRVVVLVNGKERTDDARPRGATDANSPKIDLKLDLSNDPRVVRGKKNTVEVVAFNADGSLASRGMVREFDDPNPASNEPPRLYAVVAGVSKYKNEKMNLRYAAKDAEDFAKALQLAAAGLFQKDKVRLTVLTGAGASAAPTRANLDKALAGLKDAHSGDIVVIYLAGHGVTRPGADGDWYYLTADAQSGDLRDEAAAKLVSVSSKELTNVLKQTPAQKQVLILDTCHSGAAIKELTEHRSIPGSQVRALERVKDRTGMFVLAGCAADSVSYEASRYGQGLLTYSLLMAMSGAKLRDGEYVDVGDLFGFAADKVPELARDIGGVQRPLIANPRGAPFSIGRLTTEDQAKVPIEKVKPFVVRSSFQEQKRTRDGLGLTEKVDQRLRDASAVKGARLVFVDATNVADAVQATGRYSTEGDKVTVSITLFRGDKELADFSVQGAAGKADDLAAKIVAEVEKKLPAGER